MGASTGVLYGKDLGDAIATAAAAAAATSPVGGGAGGAGAEESGVESMQRLWTGIDAIFAQYVFRPQWCNY